MRARWIMGLALAGLTGCGPPLEGNWTGKCKASDGDIELEFDLQEDGDTQDRYVGDGTATWPDGESSPLTVSITHCRGASVCHTFYGGDIVRGEAYVAISIEPSAAIETVAERAGRRARELLIRLRLSTSKACI